MIGASNAQSACAWKDSAAWAGSPAQARAQRGLGLSTEEGGVGLARRTKKKRSLQWGRGLSAAETAESGRAHVLDHQTRRQYSVTACTCQLIKIDQTHFCPKSMFFASLGVSEATHLHLEATMTDRLNHLLESTVYTQRRFDGLVRQWGQDDAEDLRQEAAIRLWQATARGNVHNPVGYFERSVKTCAIDRSRRRERRVKLVSAPRLRAPKAPTIVDWSKVRELIDMLPRTLRDTVRRWQSGMSVDNIAAKDNVPPTTVRKRLSRARRRISDLLLE